MKAISLSLHLLFYHAAHFVSGCSEVGDDSGAQYEEPAKNFYVGTCSIFRREISNGGKESLRGHAVSNCHDPKAN